MFTFALFKNAEINEQNLFTQYETGSGMNIGIRLWEIEDSQSLANALNNKKILGNLRDSLPINSALPKFFQKSGSQAAASFSAAEFEMQFV